MARGDDWGSDGERPLHLRRFEIDRRPLTHVLLSRLWRQLTLAALLAMFLLALGLDAPEGLSDAGWSTICVFGLCAILWASALLPPPITSLFAMALVPLCGILPAEDAYRHFGSKVVFFLIGSLMLSAALIKTGLSKRIATLVVERFGKTPWRLVLAVYSLSAFAATLMSEHAVAVMMFPIVVDITRALQLDKESSQLGRALSFALAWGCIIGGTLTILGGNRGPLTIGLLEEATGGKSTIGFMEYMLYSAPLVLVLFIVGLVLLRRYRSEVASTESARKLLRTKLEEMGKTSVREQVVGLIVLVTVFAWATYGREIGLDVIAILATTLLFVMRVVSWQDIEEGVHWGIILMYGGALCLSAAMTDSGAAVWLTRSLFADGFGSPTLLLISIGIAAALMTEFMSNSAVVAMLLPPTLAFAQTLGIDPRAAAMLIVLPSNFAFMFPMSTPATAVGWSLGFYRPREVASTGLVLHVVGFAAIAILVWLWLPLFGLM